MYPKRTYSVLLAFFIIDFIISVSHLQAHPDFDDFQNAEYSAGSRTVFIHLRIHLGQPGQSIRVDWILRPATSTRKQEAIDFHLDAFGSKDTTWEIYTLSPPQDGDCDMLWLIPINPMGTDTIQRGRWVSRKDAHFQYGRGEGGCAVSIPTLSEWGLILFALIILAIITTVIARRRNMSHN